MPYYRDFSKITLDEYATVLESCHLAKSRMILREDIVSRFTLLKKTGITDLADLLKKLKSKVAFPKIQKETGLSEEYLKILLREVKSLQPSPNKIAEFPQIASEIVAKLASQKIKHTRQLYDYVCTPEQRASLAKTCNLSLANIEYLARLTDLSRVRWVNHTFAFMVYEAGYRSLQALASADAESLHKAIKDVNTKYSFYANAIGLGDIKLCIEAAQTVPQDMQF